MQSFNSYKKKHIKWSSNGFNGFFFILQPPQKKHNIYIIGFSLNEIKKQSYVEMLFGICNLSSEKEILWTTFKDFSSIWRRGEHFHINTNKNLPM